MTDFEKHVYHDWLERARNLLEERLGRPLQDFAEDPQFSVIKSTDGEDFLRTKLDNHALYVSKDPEEPRTLVATKCTTQDCSYAPMKTWENLDQLGDLLTASFTCNRCQAHQAEQKAKKERFEALPWWRRLPIACCGGSPKEGDTYYL